jgi:hypothetical protein
VTEEEPNPWAEIVGPCYTVTSMARTLGRTEAEVMEAGNDLSLLMLRTEDGVYLFPVFQLHDGEVVPGLREVLLTLQTGVSDSWTWAQWLNVLSRGALMKRYGTRDTTLGHGVTDPRSSLREHQARGAGDEMSGRRRLLPHAGSLANVRRTR